MTTSLARVTSRSLACIVAFFALACTADDELPIATSTASGTTSVAATTSSTTLGVSESGGSTTAPDPTVADSTGSPPLAACACMGPEPSATDGCGTETLDAWVPGCSLTQRCPIVTAQCPRPHGLYTCRAELVFDEPALQCALEALRDGTPGRIQISEIDRWGEFSPNADALVHVLEGRTAVHLGCTWADVLGATFSSPEAHVLASPSYFSACLAETTAPDRYTCMMTGLGEDAMLPQCAG